MPFDYRAIGNEILNKLEIDPTRLGEALSTLNEVVRGYLESDAWDEVSTHCESARKLGDEMQGSELSNVIDTAYAEGIFYAYEGISCLYQAEEAKEKKDFSEESAELAKAIDCLKRSQQSFHFFEYHDHWNEIILYLNLGRIYRSQNKLNDALLAFQESLHIFKGLSIEKRQEIVKAVLAEIEKTRRPLKAKAQIFLSYAREDEE
jgi:tetratricopeptide (TPR) repeat protein